MNVELIQNREASNNLSGEYIIGRMIDDFKYHHGEFICVLGIGAYIDIIKSIECKLTLNHYVTRNHNSKEFVSIDSMTYAGTLVIDKKIVHLFIELKNCIITGQPQIGHRNILVFCYKQFFNTTSMPSPGLVDTIKRVTDITSIDYGDIIAISLTKLEMLR